MNMNEKRSHRASVASRGFNEMLTDEKNDPQRALQMATLRYRQCCSTRPAALAVVMRGRSTSIYFIFLFRMINAFLATVM